jgi:hypothetical protein
VNGTNLPPIPVNAPTIQRSDISLTSYTKRGDIQRALVERSASLSRGLKDEDLAPKRSSKRGFVWVTAFVFLLALAWGAITKPEMLRGVLQKSAIVDTAVATESSPLPVVQVPSTQSPSPLPTITITVFVPTSTDTSTPSPTSTPTVSSTPTIAHPNGYLMTVHYDQNSFYLYDRGEASRSLSGFVFERVNDDGTFTNHFEGWVWQKHINVIQPNRCLRIEIFGVKVPYLNPLECDKKILSSLSLVEDDGQIFWTPNDSSREFRMLWLDEEIARCQIEDGICDIYVP